MRIQIALETSEDERTDFITLIEDLINDSLFILKEIVCCPLQESCNTPHLITEMGIEHNGIIRVDGRRSLSDPCCNDWMVLQRLQPQRHAIGCGTDLDGCLFPLDRFSFFIALGKSILLEVPDGVRVRVARDALREYR